MLPKVPGLKPGWCGLKGALTPSPPFMAGPFLVAMVAGVTLGCTAAPGSAPAPRAGNAYVRHVAPFEVLDSAGIPYDVPFLGGFNLPRPQLVDIDGDGDDELFIQEASNRIMFFENVDGRFVWRTDHFHDLAVGEWFRFADLDGDGTFDLLSEQPFSYIRVHRNVGTATDPRFVVWVDSLEDVNSQPIFSDRQNIPNVADIDCDGRLDLFVGRLTGTITRYEADGTEPDGLPRFRHVTDRFEDIEIVAQIGSLHGANTLTLEDIDEDGDLDLFWGDYFEPGLLLIRNAGSCPNPALRGQPVPFPPGDPVQSSGYNAPAFDDVDGDGDLDLLVGVIGGAFNLNRTAADNLYFYEQVDPGRWVLRSRRFISQIDVGSESVPVFVDLDGDGDLDLLVANKIEPDDLRTSRIREFANVGTPTAPRFRYRGIWDLEGSYHFAPAFAYLNGDGKLEIVMGSWGRHLALYRNTGTRAEPRYELVDSAYVSIPRGSNTVPAFGDLDGDGDLDLVVGEASGELNYFRNDGTPREPHFVLETESWLGIDVGRRSFPALADMDGDGDLDLIIGSDGGGVTLYRNVGTPQRARFERDDSFKLPLQQFSAPAFVDLDGDGDLDVLAGSIGGGVLYFENRGGR
jgi:hypothetical protein